jgi:energy-converting hydrogenase Eha subunit C
MVVSFHMDLVVVEQMVMVVVEDLDIMAAAEAAAVGTIMLIMATALVVEEVEVPRMQVDYLDLHHTLLL